MEFIAGNAQESVLLVFHPNVPTQRLKVGLWMAFKAANRFCSVLKSIRVTAKFFVKLIEERVVYVDHLGVQILIHLHLCNMIVSRKVSESILCI